ncbi:unnamed protein product [Anisakis simplex]|uniref:ATP-dependent DNA helicase n=1 Tax=Anisakis simplex TaxID=6269 RepID=A0A0M3JMQ0_ANISI|nr:unnamed protein product [Anisakis simplex]
MEPSEQASRVRSTVIDLQAPKFAKISKEDVKKISAKVRSLNGEQARAVVKALIADDFLLIQGLPGSGEWAISFSCSELFYWEVRFSI